MIKSKLSLLKYWIPIVALLVIAIHFALVKSSNLNKWKGGGFGMYSEVHYYYDNVFISDLKQPLDLLVINDKHINDVMKDVKRMPSKLNLAKLALLISKYVTSDTISIQVWKPSIDSRNSTYSRELVHQYEFIKP